MGRSGMRPYPLEDAAVKFIGGRAFELWLVIGATMAPAMELLHPPPEGAVVPMEKSGPTTMIQAANRA
jgi:hypothetical protein